MSVDTVPVLRIQRTLRADRQAVWDAWTRPEQMKRWACPQPGGAREVTSDLRVGGEFLIEMEVDGNVFHAFGTYHEIDPPNRIVYSWDWKDENHSVGETTVTVEFRDVAEGTEVVLQHEGFPAVEAKEAHEQGWTACMMNFVALFETS